MLCPKNQPDMRLLFPLHYYRLIKDGTRTAASRYCGASNCDVLLQNRSIIMAASLFKEIKSFLCIIGANSTTKLCTIKLFTLKPCWITVHFTETMSDSSWRSSTRIRQLPAFRLRAEGADILYTRSPASYTMTTTLGSSRCTHAFICAPLIREINIVKRDNDWERNRKTTQKNAQDLVVLASAHFVYHKFVIHFFWGTIIRI